MNTKTREWGTWNGRNLPDIGLNSFINKMKNHEEDLAERILFVTDRDTGKRLKVSIRVEYTDAIEDKNCLMDIHPDCWW